MVDITPGVAFLAALQNQFNAARQGQGQGTNSLIPGLPGGGEGTDSGSVIGALGSGGISAGGVPGTATTGSSIANSLIGGTAGSGDPLAQQVAGLGGAFGLGNREPNNPSGASLGEFDNLQGGDADLLKAVLSGNPLLMLAMIGNAIANEGVPQGFGVDATGGTPFQFGGGDSTPGASGGGLSFGGGGGLNLGSNAGVNFSNNPLTNPAGGVSFSGSDRDDRSPGPGPNRGTGPSNAGR